MLLEAFVIHPFSVINDDYSCVRITQVWGKDDVDVLCAGIKRIGDKFFYSFVRAGIETFREQLNDAMAYLPNFRPK
jgi:hypothetical protein